MGKAVRIAIDDLPDAPLDAAATFHAEYVTGVLKQANSVDVMVLIFPPADHAHHGWRLASVQDLARTAAPVRVNAIVGADDAGIAKAADWLETAPGITGHVLRIEGETA